MNKHTQPIRYFGGKGNGLRNKIYTYFPNKTEYDTYIEVFGGGASVLLGKERFGVEIYNDLEKNVYSLFKVLADKNLFLKFKERCDISLYSRDLREEYRKDLKNDLDIVDRAYKYFYVNRTSVNGIGGFSVSTSCIRRNMSKSTSDFLSTIDGLYELHDRLSSVIIENKDGIELIKKYDRSNVFMYLDPPYHHDSRTSARYACDMNNEQQIIFLDTILKLKHTKILLSGYNCEEYNNKLSKWDKIEMEIKTQDGNRMPKTKVEVLWKNYNTICTTQDLREELFTE